MSSDDSRKQQLPDLSLHQDSRRLINIFHYSVESFIIGLRFLPFYQDSYHFSQDHLPANYHSLKIPTTLSILNNCIKTQTLSRDPGPVGPSPFAIPISPSCFPEGPLHPSCLVTHLSPPQTINPPTFISRKSITKGI
jgi:hypothetical protein